jgi:two-component system sensor histidine kinase RegB
LHLSGGSYNPFNFLYLVHIALAAVVLRPRYTWGLAALSALCFGTLFGDPFAAGSVSGHLDHADQMEMHLRGMWVAFAVAAVFIVYFVGRIRRALGERDAELALARERSARSDKLASLATLAAGAAHELSTPLGTIAVAAGEMQQAVARADGSALLDDARLIGDEVRRCRGILERLSTDAGDSPGEVPERVTLGSLAEALRASTSDRVVMVLPSEAAALEVSVFPRATLQALSALIDNALDASPPATEVVVEAGVAEGEAFFCVQDHGSGMAAAVLERAGEPFFTTKEPGEGMGLGLFLAHAIADRLGGRIEIESQPGAGTRARLVMPLASGVDATTRRIADAAALAQS